MSLDDHPSRNTVFDVLSNPRRRYMLSYLTQCEETEMSNLVHEVAAREYDTETAAITPEQRKRVYVSLTQTHVPKLCSVGLIEYDHESGAIQLTSRAQVVEKYLDIGPDMTPYWAVLYLAGVSIGLVVSVAIATGSLGLPVPEEAVVALIILILCLLAVTRYVTQR